MENTVRKKRERFRNCVYIIKVKIFKLFSVMVCVVRKTSKALCKWVVKGENGITLAYGFERTHQN